MKGIATSVEQWLRRRAEHDNTSVFATPDVSASLAIGRDAAARSQVFSALKDRANRIFNGYRLVMVECSAGEPASWRLVKINRSGQKVPVTVASVTALVDKIDNDIVGPPRDWRILTPAMFKELDGCVNKINELWTEACSRPSFQGDDDLPRELLVEARGLVALMEQATQVRG